MQIHTGLPRFADTPRPSFMNADTRRRREKVLKRILLDGPDWEADSGTLLDNFCAAISRKKPKPDRIGVKRVKDMERLDCNGENLNSDAATTYPALAARANFLALDRPGTAVSTKELCRDCAAPTKPSV